MEDMHQVLEAIDASFAGSTLATIVKVTGSAYKKEGAAMLIKPDGSCIGLLSAGCLEEDLVERIKQSKKKCQEIIYDMRSEDEAMWGQGAGCNGVISVWAEKLDAADIVHLQKLQQTLQAGQSVLMMKKLGEQHEYLFIPEHDASFGSWKGEVPDDCRVMENSHFYSHTLGSPLYSQRIFPRRRLVVFGAGADARPLVSFAAAAGFSVTVADWRPALCRHDYFPAAQTFLVGFPKQLLSAITLTSADSVIIMTHNFQRDRELLHQLKKQNLRYLGVLGSRNRTARLLETNLIPPFISAPAGLSIQAKGEAEIAVSIVAELIQASHCAAAKEAVRS